VVADLLSRRAHEQPTGSQPGRLRGSLLVQARERVPFTPNQMGQVLECAHIWSSLSGGGGADVEHATVL